MTARATPAGLHQALLDAHRRDDRAELIALYAEAADRIESDDPDAAGFFRTHAYVFALETGAENTHEIHARLVADGRDA